MRSDIDRVPALDTFINKTLSAIEDKVNDMLNG